MAIMSMSAAQLGEQIIQQLLKYLPSPDEVRWGGRTVRCCAGRSRHSLIGRYGQAERLKEFEDNPAALSRADQFLLEVRGCGAPIRPTTLVRIANMCALGFCRAGRIDVEHR